MFKDLTIYRTPADWWPTIGTAIEGAAKAAFVECAPTQPASTGFVPPRGAEHSPLIESINGQWILSLRTDSRSVPGPVIAKRVDEIAAAIEQDTGRKPGRKELKELKEQAMHELLPMAFIKSSRTMVWLDPASCLMTIESANQSRADHVATLLGRTFSALYPRLIQTKASPASAMSHWLGTGEAPHGFTIDRECELKSCDEMKSVVRYGRHNLDTDEVKQHIISGKVPTRVAMTWRDRVSFILTDSMTIKKLSFLDVAFEGAQSADKGEAFDADAAISTGELVQMLPDLIDALGGEMEGGAA